MILIVKGSQPFGHRRQAKETQHCLGPPLPPSDLIKKLNVIAGPTRVAGEGGKQNYLKISSKKMILKIILRTC